jgi:threonine dehydratase
LPLEANGSTLLLKPELLQPSGSYKIRGVYNWAINLSPADRARGFSTFSAGNTALALGHVARMFGVSCRSILPDYAPQNKVVALKQLGVETVLVPFQEMIDWVFRAGWRSEPYSFLNPWTDPAMIAGHGTIGLELLEDAPDTETVFVPVGGGALVAGVASAIKKLKTSVRVVGVQAESYPALQASLAAGSPVWVEPLPTICDGVAVPFTTEHLFPLLSRMVDRVVTVSEIMVREAIGLLATNRKLVAEGAGALSVAAALAIPERERGRTVCLVTGGSIDRELLCEILGGLR